MYLEVIQKGKKPEAKKCNPGCIKVRPVRVRKG